MRNWSLKASRILDPWADQNLGLPYATVQRCRVVSIATNVTLTATGVSGALGAAFPGTPLRVAYAAPVYTAGDTLPILTWGSATPMAGKTAWDADFERYRIVSAGVELISTTSSNTDSGLLYVGVCNSDATTDFCTDVTDIAMRHVVSVRELASNGGARVLIKPRGDLSMNEWYTVGYSGYPRFTIVVLGTGLEPSSSIHAKVTLNMECAIKSSTYDQQAPVAAPSMPLLETAFEAVQAKVDVVSLGRRAFNAALDSAVGYATMAMTRAATTPGMPRIR